MPDRLIGHCRDCRFWNGSGGGAATCFEIEGQDGRWYDIPMTGAAFLADERAQGEAFLMTGPDFGCSLFQAGKPRFWGDNSKADKMRQSL